MRIMIEIFKIFKRFLFVINFLFLGIFTFSSLALCVFLIPFSFIIFNRTFILDLGNLLDWLYEMNYRLLK